MTTTETDMCLPHMNNNTVLLNNYTQYHTIQNYYYTCVSPAVDNNRSSAILLLFCHWPGAETFHFLDQLQQSRGAFWDVVIGPRREPEMSDLSTLRIQLKKEERRKNGGPKLPN